MKYRTLALLATSGIPYRKELREYAGSVTGSLLMQQLDYWFAHHPDGFYKFLDPTPNNVRYSEGDSWTEELGFSKAEFRTAFDQIGVRYLSKSTYFKAVKPFEVKDCEKFYCSYHDKKNGLTWYFRNHDKVDRMIEDLCSLVPAKHRRKQTLVSPRHQSLVDKQSESTVDKESESTVSVVSGFIEVNKVDLHKSTNLTYIDSESESTFYIQKLSSEINSESTHKSLSREISISNSEDPNIQSTASLITKTESSGKQITLHGDGYSARPLQSIYAQAANVWELVDLCLDSPDLADAKPPSELLAVYNEKYKWSQWRWPWRSLNKTRDFGTFNPEVVKKLAAQLAVKDKATPIQKYDHAIATINLWEQTKGGWANLIAFCDRPVDQNIAESVEEVTETPKHIKGWHDSYHEVLHEKFRAARSLEAFFKKDKDYESWYRFAKEKFPSWDWLK